MIKIYLALAWVFFSNLSFAQNGIDSTSTIKPVIADSSVLPKLDQAPIKDSIRNSIPAKTDIQPILDSNEKITNTSSPFRRLFVDNFNKYKVNEKFPVYFFLQYAKLSNAGEFFDRYLGNGLGIGIGVIGFESPRVTIRFALSYVRFALRNNKIISDLEFYNSSYNTITTKPLGTLWVSPDLKFRPILINNIFLPYICFGINSIFNIENAAVEIDGSPVYVPLQASLYLKPGAGIDINTKWGVIFADFTISHQILAIQKTESHKPLKFLSTSLGYRF